MYRLFDEVQAKTRDLSSPHLPDRQRQHPQGVIASSPTDVGPVLKAIVESACELCTAYDAVLRLSDGDRLGFSAHHGPIPVNMKHGRSAETGRGALVHRAKADTCARYAFFRG